MKMAIAFNEMSNRFDLLFNAIYKNPGELKSMTKQDLQKLFDKVVDMAEGWDGEEVTPSQIYTSMLAVSKRKDWKNIPV